MKNNNVYVHYNFHKKCFSITKNGGKVIKWTDKIMLKNCEFRVRTGGRKRVLHEKRKNVHAFVIGEIIDPIEIKNPKKVSYNPYFEEYFYTINDKNPVYNSEYVLLEMNDGPKIWIN